MGIYLAHDHKMLKQDASVKPGKYFGWYANKAPADLLYLTYFRNNFLNSGSSLDDPVVRDPSIPILTGSPSDNRALASVGTVLGQVQVPTSLLGYPCANFTYQGVHGCNSVIPWALPFDSRSEFTITFRVYFNTDTYIVAWPGSKKHMLNPSVAFSDLAEVSDFYSSEFPYTIMLGGYSTQQDEKLYPDNFPGVGLLNGTQYRFYGDNARNFKCFGNNSSTISPSSGDQWYYVVIVGHGDGTMTTYINGVDVLHYPFTLLDHIAFYVGAESISPASVQIHADYVMRVTELSIWNGDKSSTILNKTEPIYVKKGDIWIPNINY